MFSIPIAGGYATGGITVTAGTVLQLVIPPKANYYTRITKLRYLSGATVHAVKVRRAFAQTTLSAAAAAAQAVINLTRDPGLYAANATADGQATPSVADNAIAANDFLVIEMPNGLYHLGKVSSVATLAITLTANCPTGGFAASAKVWFFGAVADLNPRTGLAPFTISPTASVATEYTDDVGGVVGTLGREEPLLLESDNATNAGTFEQVSAVYTTK